MAKPPCEHFDPAALKTADELVCQECIKTGDTWVHLRTCQTCGGTHCCDSSPNQHATKHYRATQHPVIISAEPGEQWAWCYVDEQFMRYGEGD
jgi:uncharacterized UBP type Zn finger protein